MTAFITFPFIAPVVAFFAVFILSMPARKFALAIGLIDNPGGRKGHEKAVPPIGGLLIFPTFIVISLLAGADLKIYWPLFIGLIILLVTGAMDDRFSLHAWIKFITHFSVAGLIVFFGDSQVAYLGNLFGAGPVWASYMSYPFSIIAVVLLINAVNLMDGIDGLAGGMSVVMFMWFIIAASLDGFNAQAGVLSVLVACIIGFLVFNMRNPWRRRASMFLGDSGSMCLGLTIAWFAIHLAHGEKFPLEPISVAWIIGLPIFDACAQFYRRIREGCDPFAPDRGHMHYHFLDAGFSVCKTTVSIIFIVMLMGMFGFVGYKVGIPQLVLTVLWMGALFVHMALSYKPKRYVNLIKRLKG